MLIMSSLQNSEPWAARSATGSLFRYVGSIIASCIAAAMNGSGGRKGILIRCPLRQPFGQKRMRARQSKQTLQQIQKGSLA